MSRISWGERRQLRDRLGLSIRGRLDPDGIDGRIRRALFAREVREIFYDRGLTPENVLPGYEDLRSAALREPLQTLRAAAVWERLSIGLNVVFTAWVRAIDAGTPRSVERRLIGLLARGRSRPPLQEIPLAEEDDTPAMALGIASLRYALRLHDLLSDRGVVLPDEAAFDLARRLLRSRRAPRMGETLERLLERHRVAKGDEAWVREGSRRQWEIARDPGEGWEIPTVVRPHAYRMAAFGQVAHDLGGL